MPSYDSKLFNVDPYYDDFSEDKKFLRLMFRPGYAVQARELTQIQTILQNQIERLGSHVFEEGSIVLDGQISENRVKYAKITTGSTVDPRDFIGTILSAPGRASARVVHAESGITGTLEANNSVLFFDYIQGGSGFAANDLISATAGSGVGLTATVTGPAGYFLGDALVASVGRGVRFVEGYFVLNDAQSIGVHELTGSTGFQVRDYNNPSSRVGFQVNKLFVTANQDSSLNDPAFGFYNYAAPGSDRFVIDLGITQTSYDPNDTSAVDNFSRVGFIEFMRVVDGDIVKVEKYPDYAALEDTLARRTYDESGNYTVVPFELTLKGPTSANGTQVLKAELSPGKAYVFGYEFETQGVTKLNVPCARGATHERQISRDFNRSSGPWAKVIFSGISDSYGSTASFEKNPIVILSTGSTGSSCSSIGTARIRSVAPSSGSVYDLSIYDINMTGGNFGDVTRIFMQHNSANAKHLFTLTGSGLVAEKDGCLLYQVPEGSGVTSIDSANYAVVSYFEKTISAGVTTFNVDTYSQNGMQLQFPFVPGNEISLPNVDLMAFDGNGKVLSGTAQRTAPNRMSITITNGTTGSKLFGVISQESGDPSTFIDNFYKTKTEGLTSISIAGTWGGNGLTGDGRGTTNDTLYLNGIVDVYEVLSITGTKGASAGINLSSFMTFDNGQRDSHYDWARFTLNSGVTGVTGPFSATFRYYTHGADKGPFTVKSYPNYESIPTYTSKSTGTIYSLRDCIDFRTIRDTNGEIKSVPWVPVNSAANDNDITYTHFMPRTDKVVLTRDRKFAIVSGIPSPEGDIPNDDPNAMTLYTVRVNPYTFSNTDASIRLVENKRYTMRDIGDLEKRIEAVEYYTTLNILEQEARAKSIVDDTGTEMPKRGILVDQFKGHVVADNSDPMFAASIDYENNELRPLFTTTSYDLSPSDLNNVTGNATDGVYMIDYMVSPEISNILASESIAINPFNIINYMGTLKISPSTDNWFDTTSRPVVQVNVSGENDNWVESPTLGFGTRYNDWESQWFGLNRMNAKNSRPNISRTNKLIPAKRDGVVLDSISSSTSPESMSKVVNNKKIERNVLPLARQREISISATGLKPNTTCQIFCDDMLVTGYCTGGSNITDSNGNLNTTLLFNYPNNGGQKLQNFLVGRHVIRVVDSQNIESPATWTTAAEAVYVAQGAYNSLAEDGELTTRVVETKRKSVKSEKIVSNLLEMLTSSTDIRGYSEPLSQTFYVDPSKYSNGIFIKAVDVYFNAKDSLDNIPVTLQVKPTTSGYPHPSKVLPFATATKFASEINVGDYVSSGDEGFTTFEFTSPVYLLPGREYAISLNTNSSKFSVFMGSVGVPVIPENDVVTPTSVTKQPFVRSLFKPQNTGNMIKSDSQSLAFRLHVCKFDPIGVLTLQNDGSTDAVLDINEYRFNCAEILPENTKITHVAQVGEDSATEIDSNKNIVPADGSISYVSNSQGGVVEIVSTMRASSDYYVSPVIDVERSSFLKISNIINNNNVSVSGDPLYNGELEPDNALANVNNKAKARYITKKVTLEEGLEAENITVMMSLCNPISPSGESSIKVFVRPIPVGEVDLDNINYVELTTSDSKYSSSTSDFREVSYTNIGNVSLNKFRTFSVKVVLFGPGDGSAVPKIRNLRVVAT